MKQGGQDAERPPASIEEFFTAQLAVNAQCMKELAVPPEADCPAFVHMAWGFASLHLVTVLFCAFIVMFFLGLARENATPL